MKRIFTLFLAILIMAGCSAVPLRTLWRLKNSSEQDVLSIDPNHLRAKVIHPADTGLLPNDSHLSIQRFNDNGRSDAYEFSLEVIDREEKTQGLFRKKRVALSTLKLSQKAVGDFVKLQKYLQTNKLKRRVGKMNVSCGFEDLEPYKKGEKLRPLELSILLKLRAEEDYFTLINNYKIDFEKARRKQMEGK